MNIIKKNDAQSKLPNSIKSRKLLYILILIAVLLGILGYLAYSSHKKTTKSSSATTQGAYSHSYSKLDTFTLKGSRAGSTVTFTKPQEYKLIFESEAKDQASLIHSIINPPMHVNVGAIQLAESAVSDAISDQQLSYLNMSFSSPTKTEYKSAVSAIQQYVTDRLGSLYNIQLSSAVKFNSANIKSNAWIWELSAMPKSPTLPPAAPQSGVPPFDLDSAAAPPSKNSQTSSNQETYKGQVIFAVGKSTYYYFLIYNTDYNWANNTKVWNRVTSSLKVDQ